MSWTYDTSLSTNKDKVRLRISDVDTNSQLFSDEEINAVLNDVSQDIVQASYRLAKSLAFKYARLAVSKKAGPYSEDLTQRARLFKELAIELADEADEPWDEVAEFTHEDPTDPTASQALKEFLQREDIRGDI